MPRVGIIVNENTVSFEISKENLKTFESGKTIMLSTNKKKNNLNK